MSFKIFKIDHFSITFKLNEKKEVLLKKNRLERGLGLHENVCLKGGLVFNRGIENIFKKRGAWQGTGGEKMRGVVTERNYVMILKLN